MKYSSIFALAPALFFLTACTNIAQFKTELRKAANNCAAVTRSAYPVNATDDDIRRGVYSPKRGKMEKSVDCVTQQERQVWAKYAPAFLDIYDAFRAQVAASAEDYDKGDISFKKYLADIKQETVDFNNDIRNRRASLNDDSRQQGEDIGSIVSTISAIAQSRTGR